MGQDAYLNSRGKRWLTGSGILLFILFTIGRLNDLFPYTGLAYIFFYPLVVILNAGIIVVAINLTKQASSKRYAVTWVGTIIITLIITIGLHPQEFRPNVFRQVSSSISAIRAYGTSPITDLDLPLLDDFSRFDCEVIDSSERYIVALYKYRHTIPLDGSYKLYQTKSIFTIESIPRNLSTGQDKLIWWILSRTEN